MSCVCKSCSNSRSRYFADLPTFEKVVYLIIGYAIRIFIGSQWSEIFKVRRWHLFHKLSRSAHMCRQRTDPALVKSGKRKNVGSTVAKLREEAHDGLGGMIGADDQASASAGDRVLCNHALPRLDVSEQEILATGIAEVDTGDQIEFSMASAAGLISIRYTSSAPMVSKARCASCSSACAPYGSRTAINLAS